jgi:hypothetical protein
MARIGSNIQAGLGRVDYSPLFQGMSNAQQFAAQGNAALAQSIANIGQIAGGAIRDYKKKKEEEESISKTIGFLETNFKKDPSTYSIFADSKGAFDKSAAEAAVRSVGPTGVMSFINFTQAAQANRDVKGEKDREKSISKTVNDLLATNDPVALQAKLAAADPESVSRYNQTKMERDYKLAQTELVKAQTANTAAEGQVRMASMGIPKDTRPAPPTGFEYDPQSNALRAIPGGPADIAAQERAAKAQEKESEKASAEKKAKMAEEQAKTYIFSTLDNISRAKNLIENKGAGGAYEGAFPGVMNKLGRPETMQLMASYKQIASNVLLDQIYRLKEVSPTGATGLGATNMTEINRLTERLGELNPELDSQTQIQILNDIERSLKNLSGNPIIENEYAKYQEQLKKESPIYAQQMAQREEAEKKRKEEEDKRQRRNLLMQNFGTK